MSKTITHTFTLLFAFTSGLSVFGRSLEDQKQFIQDCERQGVRTVSSPRIVDYRVLTGGASSEVVCVYDVTCSAPERKINERNAYFCLYNLTTGCEDFDSCVREMPNRQINLRPAGGPSSTPASQCKDEQGYRFVRGKATAKDVKVEPICIQTPQCVGKKTTGLVACPSTGKTQPQEVKGKVYQVPVCPSTDHCIANSIPLPTPETYKSQLAQRAQANELNTAPHNSKTQDASSFSLMRNHEPL